jgi:hypothetical protein
MTTQLAVARPDEVETLWPHVLPHIETAARESNGRFSTDDIKRALLAVDAKGATSTHLWAAFDPAQKALRAVAIVEVRVYPSSLKACAVLVLTGSARRTWLHHLDTLKAKYRAQGCALFESLARPGWERVLKGKMRKSHVFLECRL